MSSFLTEWNVALGSPGVESGFGHTVDVFFFFFTADNKNEPNQSILKRNLRPIVKQFGIMKLNDIEQTTHTLVLCIHTPHQQQCHGVHVFSIHFNYEWMFLKGFFRVFLLVFVHMYQIGTQY